MTGRVAVVGEEPRVEGFALAGALVRPADDEEQVQAAWEGLPPDVVVVVLTPAAAEALHDELERREPGRLTVVMPS